MGISRFLWLGALATACASHATTPASVAPLPLVLKAADGTVVSFESLWRQRSATVLIFWSGDCPCVRRYQARMEDLLDRYPAERVRVLGVSSNAGESFDQILRIAKERGVRLPLYRDEDGQVARAVDATSTPTVIVLDGKGAIRFRGWMDNERLPDDPKRQPWLDLALQGLLENRAFAARTPIFGCTITRSLSAAPSGSCCQGHLGGLP
jgi:peroxiredoxin